MKAAKNCRAGYVIKNRKNKLHNWDLIENDVVQRDKQPICKDQNDTVP